MTSFFNVLLIISPVFILILVGFLCRLNGLLTVATGKELNKFIFYISLPALLISKISQTNIKLSDQWGAYLSILLATFCVAFIAILYSKYFGLKPKQKWACAHGCVRSNMAFIGLPIVFYASDANGMAVAALLMGLTIPVYNVIGVVFLTLGKERTDEFSFKFIFQQIVWSVLKNPLIGGCILGGIFYFIKINPKNFMMINLELIGSISLPLSLICMGIQTNTAISWERMKRVIFPAFSKLILCPAIGILFLYLFYTDPSPEIILSLLILLGCPSAVASYVMAVEMDVEPELAGDIVLASTFFSFFTFTGILLTYQFVLI